MEKINLRWDNENKLRLVEIIYLGNKKSTEYSKDNYIKETEIGYVGYSIEFQQAGKYNSYKSGILSLSPQTATKVDMILGELEAKYLIDLVDGYNAIYCKGEKEMQDNIKLIWHPTNETELVGIKYNGKRNFGECKLQGMDYTIKFSDNGAGFSDGVLRVYPNADTKVLIKLDYNTKSNLDKTVSMYNLFNNSDSKNYEPLTAYTENNRLKIIHSVSNKVFQLSGKYNGTTFRINSTGGNSYCNYNELLNTLDMIVNPNTTEYLYNSKFTNTIIDDLKTFINHYNKLFFSKEYTEITRYQFMLLVKNLSILVRDRRKKDKDILINEASEIIGKFVNIDNYEYCTDVIYDMVVSLINEKPSSKTNINWNTLSNKVTEIYAGVSSAVKYKGYGKIKTLYKIIYNLLKEDLELKDRYQLIWKLIILEDELLMAGLTIPKTTHKFEITKEDFNLIVQSNTKRTVLKKDKNFKSNFENLRIVLENIKAKETEENFEDIASKIENKISEFYDKYCNTLTDDYGIYQDTNTLIDYMLWKYLGQKIMIGFNWESSENYAVELSKQIKKQIANFTSDGSTPSDLELNLAYKNINDIKYYLTIPGELRTQLFYNVLPEVIQLEEILNTYNKKEKLGEKAMKEITNKDEIKQLYKDMESLENQCIQYNEISNLDKIAECIDNFSKLYNDYWVKCYGTNIQLYIYCYLMRRIWLGEDNATFDFDNEREKIKEYYEKACSPMNKKEIKELIENFENDFKGCLAIETSVRYFSIIPKIIKLKEILEKEDDDFEIEATPELVLLNKKRQFINLARDLINENSCKENKLVEFTNVYSNEKYGVLHIKENKIKSLVTFVYEENNYKVSINSYQITIYFGQDEKYKALLNKDEVLTIPKTLYSYVIKAIEQINTKYNKDRKLKSEYYYISNDGDIFKKSDEHKGIDDDRFLDGNYFNNKEDAEIAKLCKKLINLL